MRALARGVSADLPAVPELADRRVSMGSSTPKCSRSRSCSTRRRHAGVSELGRERMYSSSTGFNARGLEWLESCVPDSVEVPANGAVALLLLIGGRGVSEKWCMADVADADAWRDDERMEACGEVMRFAVRELNDGLLRVAAPKLNADAVFSFVVARDTSRRGTCLLVGLLNGIV